ncbi:hypothetical protein XM25_15230 [Devosia sp. H5989]|nr:hypothetical protein XM25_15230 [Devosia sp. H5989]
MRKTLLLAMTLFWATFAYAGDVVLRTSDRASFDESMLEMVQSLPQKEGRELFFAVMAFAVGKAENDSEQSAHFLAEVAYLKQYPDEFLRRIAPLEGLTGQEILDAEPPVRPTSR